jgi:hypothetical protein
MRNALCGFMFLAACAAAQTVEGTIVDSATGNGIAGAQVFLSMSGPASEETRHPTTTDALGHFLFEGIQTGTYRFDYSSLGYMLSDPMSSGSQVQISGDGKPVKLEGRMIALPRISGRVVNGDGEGIANALLEIIGRNSPPVTSDATGKFELRLDPGAYILSVLPPTSLKPPDPEPDSDQVLVWTRTFYPGVAHLEAASKIVLRSGSDLSGIVIKLLAVPSHAVRGVLLNPDGSPAPKATITLGVDQDSTSGHTMGQRDLSTLRTEANSDGAFEFPQVADGEWRLSAEVESGGEKRRATEWIDMAGHEREGVRLYLAYPFTVRGQVIVETPQGVSPPDDPSPVFLVPQGLRAGSDTGMSNWMLFPEYHFEPAIPRNLPDAAEIRQGTKEIITDVFSTKLGAFVAAPDAGGNFSLKNVYPGSYRIVSRPPPPPYYMAEVRIGETGLTTPQIDLSSGAAPITIVYKTDGGSVRGTAEKCAGGVVLLIPQDPAIQALGFFQSARCDPNDQYEFTAVRPGDYFAPAFAAPGGMPRLDDILLSQASKVTVHVDETTTVDLRAIQRPGY